ncbi:Squamosa promoter-binding-like protein 8 [Raphanus sativus]|uniref:Squamosa promoter-binding-like protein 8 n=1 Tax=Raphanus sativus TaxID=3726 RepID=A0A6J0NZZ5_RAPSA|nr:squamosa promoter-binding-like protein 8 [Raphanus sativus]KAJ4895095.1 Squamosa promoter-binding-like protein 8 [Raphanus sativus]
MLDYEWDNPSAIMVSGEEQRHHHHQDLDPTRALSIFESTQTNHHHQSSYNNFPPPLFSSLSNQQHLTVLYGHHHQTAHIPTNQFHHSFYDANPYASSPDSIYHAHSPASALFSSFDQTGPAGSGSSSYNFLIPKTEVDVVSRSPLDFCTSNRIGLNLGGRTYFSAGDDDFVSRLYRRSRTGELGMGSTTATPRCQAERCNADLSHAKHYHRRHKVCEFHSKASTVVAAGLSQRFCQQCSRFHLLSEFDNGKRSCRKRLADHNRRRRKCHQAASASGKHTTDIINTSKSANDSGLKSSSASPSPSNAPTTISLECFRQTTASSSTSAIWGSLAPTYNI